jgi:hypothetical protein
MGDFRSELGAFQDVILAFSGAFGCATMIPGIRFRDGAVDKNGDGKSGLSRCHLGALPHG